MYAQIQSNAGNYDLIAIHKFVLDGIWLPMHGMRHQRTYIFAAGLYILFHIRTSIAEVFVVMKKTYYSAVKTDMQTCGFKFAVGSTNGGRPTHASQTTVPGGMFQRPLCLQPLWVSGHV